MLPWNSVKELSSTFLSLSPGRERVFEWRRLIPAGGILHCWWNCNFYWRTTNRLISLFYKKMFCFEELVRYIGRSSPKYRKFVPIFKTGQDDDDSSFIDGEFTSRTSTSETPSFGNHTSAWGKIISPFAPRIRRSQQSRHSCIERLCRYLYYT